MPPSRFQAWLEALPEFDPTEEGYFIYAKANGTLPNIILRCRPENQVIYYLRSTNPTGNWYIDPISGTKQIDTDVGVNMNEVLANLGLESWTFGQWGVTNFNTDMITMAWRPAD